MSAPPWVVALAEEGIAVLDSCAGELRSIVHEDRRNSDLYWCTAEGGQQVLVKQGRNWDVPAGRTLHTALNTLLARLRKRDERVIVPVPLASAASPPGICLTVVEGLPAKRLMRGELETMSDGVRSGMPFDRLLALAHLSGVALASYHEAHRDDVDDRAVDEARRAFDALRSTRLLRRVPAPAPPISAVDVSFSWNDFGFHNVLVTPDGQACLLDVPPAPEPKVVHRDIARALAELSERYPARQGPWIPRDLRREVATGFLEGYSAVSGRDLHSAGDQRLLQFHEAQAKIRRARRKLQSREWREALPAVGIAVNSYRNLRQ